MKNEHLYKKLKYELALSYLYNTNKYHKFPTQVVCHVCKCFNVEFNNWRFDVITNCAYSFVSRMREHTSCFYITNEILTDYAHAHHIRLYDMEESKLVNPVQYTISQYQIIQTKI